MNRWTEARDESDQVVWVRDGWRVEPASPEEIAEHRLTFALTRLRRYVRISATRAVCADTFYRSPGEAMMQADAIDTAGKIPVPGWPKFGQDWVR